MDAKLNPAAAKAERDEIEETGIPWETPSTPLQSSDFILLDGKRYVKPYYFEFISHAKNRWAGQTLVDVFSREFKGRTPGYYARAVQSGRIRVDNHKVDLSFTLRPSQKISHFLHRHEPPVRAGGVKILHSDPDTIAVCKPASVPVHPCGQYRKNTVIGILEAELGISPLFPVHRLDRLVSGLLILARNAGRADWFRRQIESGSIQKEYVAVVLGLFPDGDHVVDVDVVYDPREGRSSVDVKGEGEGKAARTKFCRITSNGIHSVVLCKPITGRTHQIRVHLQYMGHPIANDMLYLSNHDPPRRRSTHGVGAEKATSLTLPGDRNVNIDGLLPEDAFVVDPMCTNCPYLGPQGYDCDEDGLWLHCLRYTGHDWSFECPAPEWAYLD